MTRVIALLLLFPLSSIAQQRVNLVLNAGVANYTGDIQDKRFTGDQSGVSLGAALSVRLIKNLYIRGGLAYGKVGADDKKSKRPDNLARNVNFKSSIVEASAVLDYSLLDIKKYNFAPYVFVGLGFFHFNPYTHDTSGTKYYLHKLGTEGQGLSVYPNRKPYSLMAMAIPFGGGIRFRINQKTVIGYEIGLRKTGTDYLDDVSDHYADAAALQAAHGAKAVELSYRGGELKNGSPDYPSNALRGGPKVKDWYYFQGITVSIGIFDREGRLFEKSPFGRVSCPRPVL
jgi:hypothetical protein